MHADDLDLKRVAAKVAELVGGTWSVRRQRFIVTHLPSGRIFYAAAVADGWASMTCASMSQDRHDDLRCHDRELHCAPHQGETHEDTAALVIAAMFETARDDLRNSNRYAVSLRALSPSMAERRARQDARSLAREIGRRTRNA